MDELGTAKEVEATFLLIDEEPFNVPPHGTSRAVSTKKDSR